LNAQTGDFIWSYQTGGNLYSSPAVVNGVLYVGSYDHKIYAIGESQTGSGIPMDTYYLIAAVIAVVIVVAAAVLELKKRR
jgi:outer membrane protein assembly factor BamB